jgi:hypothetical protein
MPRPTRRQALASAVAGLAGLSGCSLLESGDTRTGTEIISAHVSSRLQEPRRVSVLFERDGGVVYWRRFSVPAYDPEDDVLGSTDVPVDSLTDEPAVWTVRAFNHHTEQYTNATYGPDVDPEIRINVNITEDDALEIWKGT